MHRTITAFLAASFVAALCWSVAAAAVLGVHPFAAVLQLPVYWAVCFVVGLILGYPLFWLARRAGPVRWWSAMLAGFPVGAVLPFLLASNMGWADAVLLPAWAWGLVGSAAAFVFWLALERQAAGERPGGA